MITSILVHLLMLIYCNKYIFLPFNIRCVALGFKPCLANRFRFLRWRSTVSAVSRLFAVFYQWGHTRLKCIIISHFLERNLASLPKILLANPFLDWFEFCHECIMTLSHILMPTFFYLQNGI